MDAADRANVYVPASASLVRVGAHGTPRGGYQPDRNNWAPRIGLAWRPGQRQTALRAGYGIYYDQSALATGEGLYFNAPYFDFKLYYSLPTLPLTLSDPFPKNFPVTLPSSALAFQQNLRTRIHAAMELQSPTGNGPIQPGGVDLCRFEGERSCWVRAISINHSPSPKQPNLRPVPMFDDINILESRGNSSYQSFQARFQQTLRHGLTAIASYTCVEIDRRRIQLFHQFR